MKRTIYRLLKSKTLDRKVHIEGWVKAFRSNRFITLNDGSCLQDIQAVLDFENTDKRLLKRITTGAAVAVSGLLVKSQGKGQKLEIQIETIEVLGDCDAEKYPIQPKKHNFDFLREHAHLRIRTRTFGAIMRVRSQLSFAVHHFFHKEDFNYVHTPIITGSDAEGAGEMFRVTTLEDYKKDETEDFFGKKTHLTVSGQLEAETYAMGLGKVYTFGPTFRAENSNTSRHLSEFWMIEPEVAFKDLKDIMFLAEKCIKKILQHILEHCQEDLEFLEKRLLEEEKSKPKSQRASMTLIEKLRFVVDNPFERITYNEAFKILKRSKTNRKKKFQYPIDEWGVDLQSEHERYLVEKHFETPVIIYNYPAEIKAFYMRSNKDKRTVRAMDVLFPGIGEIIGGSQREERLEVLQQKIKDFNMDEKELEWYLDTRRFGSAVHSGFGLGFERLVLFATGMDNIRDVIPFPRTPKNAKF